MVRFNPTPPAFNEMRRIRGSLVLLPNSSIVVARCACDMDPSKRLLHQQDAKYRYRPRRKANDVQPLDTFFRESRLDQIYRYQHVIRLACPDSRIGAGRAYRGTR